MSYEMIDKIIENFDTCGHVMLTGGEPLLCLDEIEYFVHKINDANKVVGAIELTTNGTILDKRIIDIYSTFVSKDEQRLAYLRISNDQFHDVNQSKKAYDFYSQLAEQYHNIIVRYELQDGEVMPIIRFAGRAKNMLTDIDKYLPYADYLSFELKTPHRIKIQDNNVSCTLIICPNGGVVFGEDFSFNTEDEISIGNIKDNSLSEIIDQHNDNCLLSCCDSFNFDKVNCTAMRFESGLKGFIEKDYTKVFNSDDIQFFCYYASTYIGRFIMERLYNLRKKAKELFPSVTAEEIIKIIPFPYDIYEYVATKSDYVVNHSTRLSPGMKDKYINGVEKELYEKAISACENTDLHVSGNKFLAGIETNQKTTILRLCNNMLTFLILVKSQSAKFPASALWGHTDITETKEYLKLKCLDFSHKSGSLPPKNDSILLCYTDEKEEFKKSFRASESDIMLSYDTLIHSYLGSVPTFERILKQLLKEFWESSKVEVFQDAGFLPDETL